MEFTLQQLRDLAATQDFQVLYAETKYHKSNVYGQDGFVTPFELRVENGVSAEWGCRQWTLTPQTDKTGTKLRVELSNSTYVYAPVLADTPEGWAEALKVALTHKHAQRWCELVRTTPKLPYSQFTELLETTLKAKNLWRKGVTHSYETCCHVTLTVKSGSKKTEFQFHVLEVDLQAEVQRVVDWLEATGVPVGKTTLAEYLEECAECPTVGEVDFSYDCGDKRSYGSLSVSTRLPFGKLEWDLSVSSGGGVESTGSECLKVNGVEVDYEDLPTFEVPHYYGGVETCQRWETRAPETLRTDLQTWLTDEWCRVHEEYEEEEGEDEEEG